MIKYIVLSTDERKTKAQFFRFGSQRKKTNIWKDQEGTNKNKGGKANTTYQKVAMTRKKLDASKIEN